MITNKPFVYPTIIILDNTDDYDAGVATDFQDEDLVDTEFPSKEYPTETDAPDETEEVSSELGDSFGLDTEKDLDTEEPVPTEEPEIETEYPDTGDEIATDETEWSTEEDLDTGVLDTEIVETDVLDTDLIETDFADTDLIDTEEIDTEGSSSEFVACEDLEIEQGLGPSTCVSIDVGCSDYAPPYVELENGDCPEGSRCCIDSGDREDWECDGANQVCLVWSSAECEDEGGHVLNDKVCPESQVCCQF